MENKTLLDYKVFISREPAVLDAMYCNVEVVSDGWGVLRGIRARVMLTNGGEGRAFEWYFDGNNYTESLMELEKIIDGLSDIRYHLVNYRDKRDNE